jgi:hypothetical protein
MHGTVGFNAELDQGSTFWFTAQVDIQVPEPVRAVKPLEVDFLMANESWWLRIMNRCAKQCVAR